MQFPGIRKQSLNSHLLLSAWKWSNETVISWRIINEAKTGKTPLGWKSLSTFKICLWNTLLNINFVKVFVRLDLIMTSYWKIVGWSFWKIVGLNDRIDIRSLKSSWSCFDRIFICWIFCRFLWKIFLMNGSKIFEFFVTNKILSTDLWQILCARPTIHFSIAFTFCWKWSRQHWNRIIRNSWHHFKIITCLGDP